MNTAIKYIAFILVLVVQGQSKTLGQTVEKLVRFHKNTSSVMATLTRKKIKDKIYVMYGYDNKDTLYINNVAQDSITEKYGDQRPRLISSFDSNHNILKTGVIQTDKGKQIGYRNFIHFGDQIFLSLFMDGDQVIYNGEIVWQGKELGLNYPTRYLVLELDLDLNYKNLYIFDHLKSGIQAIAVQEGRLHLFGHLINEDEGRDTVLIEGHELIAISDARNWATVFSLTFDTGTGELINELKIDGGYMTNTGVVESVRINESGDVFQLIRTTASGIILEGIPYKMTDFASNTYLLKYDRNGELINKAFFTLNNNEVDIKQMELTRDGDVILHGYAYRLFGVNGRLLTEFPYLDAAILLRLDGESLEPEWYDYYAAERSSATTIWIGGMTIDEKDNIYTMFFLHNSITNKEDKEGNSIKSGNHLYKYNSEGLRLNDYHTPSNKSGNILYPHAIGEDTLLFFAHLPGSVGNLDSMLQITKHHASELILFQYVLHGQIDAVEEIISNNNYRIYPNPVRLGEDSKIKGDVDIPSGTPYVLMDQTGRICDMSKTGEEGVIKLPQGIKSGHYYIQGGKNELNFSAKIVVIE